MSLMLRSKIIYENPCSNAIRDKRNSRENFGQVLFGTNFLDMSVFSHTPLPRIHPSPPTYRVF